MQCSIIVNETKSGFRVMNEGTPIKRFYYCLITGQRVDMYTDDLQHVHSMNRNDFDLETGWLRLKVLSKMFKNDILPVLDNYGDMIPSITFKDWVLPAHEDFGL